MARLERLVLLAVCAVALGDPVPAVLTRKPSTGNSTPHPFEELPEAAAKDLEAPSDCSTPANLPGNCVRIQSCHPLYSLMQQRVNSVHVDFLRRSQCGFEGRSPKVCCPQRGRAPSQSGQIPDWSRVSGFTPQTSTDGPPRDAFPTDVPATQPRSCGRQHVSTGLTRVVGGLPARNDTTLARGRWNGMCVENAVPSHVGRLLSFAPRRVCDPLPPSAAMAVLPSASTSAHLQQ